MDAAADPLQPPRPAEGSEPGGKPAESQDDGYETSNSGEARRRAASPAPSPPPPPAYPPYHDYPYPYKFNEPYDMSRDSFPKRDCEDPYSFVEEEACALLAPPAPPPHHAPPHQMPHHQHQMHHMMMAQPKKRGRKKKLKDENGMEIKCEVGADGALLAPRPVKERKKHDRFNGMSEEEVARRTLPDHLSQNLDIIIIGINPGLFAAYKGHHYAGPGNHFWKCLYLSGLTREQMSADEDYKLLNFGIGFTNMVPRPTKGSADLTRREIKEGSAVLLEKLQTFRPKVAVFNGKLIYEVFSGKKEFCFGKQPDPVPGTNTYMWVMPSSSARCAQLPRAADKVPFYAALKKFRDFLNGLVPHVAEDELVFPDNTARRPQDELEIRRLTMEPEPGDTIVLEDGTEVPIKKKRGRPKKIKLENGETAPAVPRAPRPPRPAPQDGDAPPKKKRGRPKKIRPEDQQFLMQQQQQQQISPQSSLLPPQPLYSEQQQQQQYQHQMMYPAPVHEQYNYHTPTPPNQTAGGSGVDGSMCGEFYSSPRHQYSPGAFASLRPSRSPLCAGSPAGYSHSPGYARSPAPPAAPPAPAAPAPAASSYPSPHNDSYNHQGGSSCGSAGSAGCALAASPHPSPLAAVDFSPPPTVQSSGGVEESGVLCGGMFDSERLYLHEPPPDKNDHYHYQDQGGSVSESPRLDQMHQHPNLYQNNYNRATPDGSNEAFSPAQSYRHSEHHLQQDNDSQGEFISSSVKPKSQDVSSKSLSGLESLVDQIPSIAEGGGGAGGSAPGGGSGSVPPPADTPALPDYAPLYPPYPPYAAGAAYGNNGYGVGGAWVGYGGGWGPGLVRGGGYLPPPADWQYPYPVPSYSYAQPYNYYPQQQTHYLSTPGLLELHKNVSEGAGVPPVPSVPSVGFGPFC